MMCERAQTKLYGLVGTVVPWGSLLTSHFVHEVVSILVLLVGLVTGIVALSRLLRVSPVEVLTTYAKLCDECRSGNEPNRCPIPKKYRPKDCPKNM